MEAARRMTSTEHRNALQGFAPGSDALRSARSPAPGERIPLGSTASLIVSEKRR